MTKREYFTHNNKTVCILKNKKGNFIGTAKLHENDEKSNFTGYTIAELKAERAYYKNQLTEYKKRIKTIKWLLNDIIKNCEQVDTKIKKRFYIQIKYYTQRIKDYKNYLDDINDEIIHYLETKEKIELRFNKGSNN